MYNNVGMGNGVSFQSAYNALNANNTAAATSTSRTAAKIEEKRLHQVISYGYEGHGWEVMKVDFKEEIIYCLKAYKPTGKSYENNTNRELWMEGLLKNIQGPFTVIEHEGCDFKTTYYRTEESGEVSCYSRCSKDFSKEDLNKFKALQGTQNFILKYKNWR